MKKEELNDNELIIETPDGKEELAQILFTNHSEEFNKDYVIFEVNGEVTAASYTPDSDEENGSLDDIETDEEWEYIEALVDEYYDGDNE